MFCCSHRLRSKITIQPSVANYCPKTIFYCRQIKLKTRPNIFLGWGSWYIYLRVPGYLLVRVAEYVRCSFFQFHYFVLWGKFVVTHSRLDTIYQNIVYKNVDNIFPSYSRRKHLCVFQACRGKWCRLCIHASFPQITLVFLRLKNTAHSELRIPLRGWKLLTAVSVCQWGHQHKNF